ncbi:hypothetical protein PN462_14880 [Spirulina sp. CS-785/01]|nr:hypothetical protein [Spirulina sp. CS-785/01]MDB9314394.1 hypothetical protein [Spirulina sp. CS-785/01]
MSGQMAYCVIQSNDWVAYEDLNVKEFVGDRDLAKSVSDAGLYAAPWTNYRGTHGKLYAWGD